MFSTNHDSRPAVAAAFATTVLPNGHTFTEEFQAIARRLLFSCPATSTSERQFLQDVARGRYPMKALERMTRIAAGSTRPEHREALALFVREISAPRYGAVSIAAAFDEETRTNGEADMAQRYFERERTRANQERAIDALHAQEIATREAITAVRTAKVG